MMKTAEQILIEVTGTTEWMGDTYIVTQIQAVEAMERYADQFKPFPLACTDLGEDYTVEIDDQSYKGVVSELTNT